MNNKQLVPELRFKEFNGDWNIIKFGDTVDICRGGSPRPIYNYITDLDNGVNWIKIGDVSKADGVINSTKEKIIPEGISKSREVYPGDIILSNSMSYGRPYIVNIYGCIHDGWILINDKNKYYDKKWLIYLLSSEKVRAQYKKLAAGGVVINLNIELVKSVKLIHPDIKEQEKIANFLSTIDDRIELFENKLESLKKTKKGYIQKIFDQEIRFKDEAGNDYPKWKEKRILDIAKYKNSNKKVTDVLSEGKYNLYDVSKVIGKTNSYQSEFPYIAIIKDGSGVGRTMLLPGLTSIIGTMGSISSNDCNIGYLYYLFKILNIKKYIVGGAIPHIYYRDYKNHKCNIPCMQEQEKIAKLFTLFDDTIKLCERKKEHYIEIKKGFLQKLFI